MSLEELEAIRLCDLLQVEQSEAADRMEVSRKTFRNDLKKARQKVADALVNGKAIEISGGEYVNSGECKVDFCSQQNTYGRYMRGFFGNFNRLKLLDSWFDGIPAE
ncbi:hypothetical protein EO93_15305 [Methanosarcina sp. 1.H.A.2.2]|nr:DUF134 domain-containing protein [Methanosarcina sp. 1.H.A.2.2]KKH46665.1 hypothetical protein EO93_15305 [Methanosarcina sp. 1.H.A.2.2]